MTEFKCLKAVFIFNFFRSFLTIYIVLYGKWCPHERQRKTLWLSLINPSKSKNSRLQKSFKIGVLKNLANFTRKTYALESLFNKAAGLKACDFIKKWLRHKCFSVNFLKFLKAPFLIEHFRWLLRVSEGTSLVKFSLMSF